MASKKGTKTKKSVVEQTEETISGMQAPIVEEIAEVVTEEVKSEDAQITENQVLEEVQEEPLKEISKTEEVKKTVRTSEDPFADTSTGEVQTMTSVNPIKKNKKLKNKQISITFDEWNGTYIM